MSSKIAKKRYQKMDPILHVLKRPDMYVGSIRLRAVTEFTAHRTEEGIKIQKGEIMTSPAILRVFIEPLSNAIDNVERSRKTHTPCTKIKVSIDMKTGETSIWNDGDIVPVEVDEEEKCYNHSMIFGQLLTGSNYDDEEERVLSGRNGLGCKLCLKKGTLVPQFNGEISKVEDIEIGSELIGDDGTPRIVVNKCEGTGRLFEISQPRGNSYIVNEEHKLCLKMPDHKVIFWNTAKNGWSMLWLDKENKKVTMKSISASPPSVVCPECHKTLCGNLTRHWRRVHNDKHLPNLPRIAPTVIPPDTPEVKETLEKMKDFADTIPDDNTLDISVKEYVKLTPTTKGRLTGYVGECVQWKEQKVTLDPYVLGLWLGDGFQSGYGFAINAKDDPEILEYLEKWGANNDATFKQNKNNHIYYGISSTSKSGIAPLKKQLSEYNLINNKHIPNEYIVNSREVRLAVLAGMIDSDGCVTSDGRRITISQGMVHSRLASDIIFLAKSLGFMCSSHVSSSQWKYKGELRRGNAININISGEGVEDIPTLVARKKCLPPLKRNTTNTGKITVKEVQAGEYVGLQVDGPNNRFVLEDFTVTHNCNVFSTKFKVIGCDPNNGKILTQEWSRNMRDTDGPKVKSTKLKRGYTEVTWTPDFARFGLKRGYTQDIINLYTRFVVDAAMLSKVDVYLNNEIVPINSLADYAAMYDTPTEEKLYIKTKTSEILVTPAREYETVSFVNGVYTRLGGKHVDSWSEALFRPIVEKFNGVTKKATPKKKKTTPKINITDVRQFFRLFVVSTVVRPEFDGQDKNKLESPEIPATVKQTHINTIFKWSVMDNIEEIIRAKEMVVLKKAERVTRKTKVEGLDPANKAGGKDSHKCSLFICEGLSAKTYVVAGIQEGVYGLSGRDWFGVLPVTGKVLNVRNAVATSIAANKVICKFIHALGVKHGVDYTIDSNYKKLNYGRVIIIADADVDGIHIEGLIMNVIHSLYPTLLERDESFVVSMKTPIARVIKKRGEDTLFYDERRFNSWLMGQKTKVNVKYYKGLGTTKAEDVPDTFGLKMVEYENDEDAFANMQKAFHKKYADARKEWLGEYNPEAYEFSLDDVGDKTVMSISNFINGELIKFSHADCARSIPNGIDGLKESQRKLLYAVKKRKLRYSGKSLKVAQLAGYTAEHSNYHHGEKNLFDTIIGMANEFPGTNNIPLLYRDGMFGTRLSGAQDAADGRYIFTKMDALTELIYREEDEPLLTLVNDDGDLVQPEHYIPIIPMILVNGVVAGIGTGWSSTVPCFNPLDLIAGIKVWIENDGEVLIEDPDDETNVVSMFPEFTPWYRGFKGDIEKSSESRYVTYGIVMEGKRNTVEVTELPIGMWTDKFKDFVEDLKADKKLDKVQNYSTPKDVKFILTENDSFHCDLDKLKLHSYLYTSNMVMFNENNQLRKHKNVDEVLDNFCHVRFDYYVKRKRYQLKSLKAELRFLGNKERFVQEVIDEDLLIMNEKESDIISELEARGYDEDPKKVEGEGGYDYLLRMQVRTFTADKVRQLKNDIASTQEKLDGLRATTEQEIWLRELDEFEASYRKWLRDIEKEVVKTKKRRGNK
jgi:DNA topoisomerase-2